MEQLYWIHRKQKLIKCNMDDNAVTTFKSSEIKTVCILGYWDNGIEVP
jgi:hypothetical protein